MSDTPAKILYCRCAFAQTVPEDTKNAVLAKLCESGKGFEAVADLCEMSARKDSRLTELIAEGVNLKIVACYPRAVKWLFHHAGASFHDGSPVEVLNMREANADEICRSLLEEK